MLNPCRNTNKKHLHSKWLKWRKCHCEMLNLSCTRFNLTYHFILKQHSKVKISSFHFTSIFISRLLKDLTQPEKQYLQYMHALHSVTFATGETFDQDCKRVVDKGSIRIPCICLMLNKKNMKPQAFDRWTLIFPCLTRWYVFSGLVTM